MKVQPNFLAIINFTFFTATILFGIAACNPNQKDKDVVENQSIAVTHNDSRFEDSAKANDATFLEQAALINLHEIGLGQLGNEKSASPDILVLSKMLVDHHTTASADLKLLADKKNISLPVSVENNQDEGINKLVKEDKKTFDKLFLSVVIQNHKDAISTFQSADSATIDTEIKDYIAVVMPTLKQHLVQAEKIQLNNK